MNQDNPTDETLSGTAHVDAADGGAAVDSGTLTLDEINSLLGKDFKDKDSALKAVKDTFSYVGKKKEDIAAEMRPTAQAPSDAYASKDELAQLKNELFYANHPEYKGYESTIKMMGNDPSEVTGTDAFKALFAKVKVADEAEQKKSVVSSNSRLGETQTISEKAVQVANARNSSSQDVADTFAAEILTLMGNN